MSILLDAVTRAKQQELDDGIDPILTPRAAYHNDKVVDFWKPLAILACAIIAGVSLAWLINRIPSSAPAPKQEDFPLVVNVPQNKPQTPEKITKPQNPIMADEVQIAGKIALPLSRSLSGDDVTITDNMRERLNKPIAHSVAQPAKPVVSNHQEDPLALSLAAALKDYNMEHEAPTESYQAASEPTPIDSGEPIILGANPNQRGLETLESLKRQVNNAADDLGLTTEQTRADDELVERFQLALADVEKQKALEKPMSPVEVDPIDESAGDTDYPSYGSLPSGVQLQVPEFHIVAHVYASDSKNRWLNVDGAELQEGDKIKGKLQIVEIRPRDVVLLVDGTKFKVPATN